LARRSDTRDRLISTAAELFRRQGYAQTGVNEIISGAQATSGSFYHFFETKEDLLVAVVDHLGSAFEAAVFAPAEAGDGSPRARIEAVLAAARRDLEEHGPDLGSPLGALAAELAPSHPRVRRQIDRRYASWSRRIEAMLDDAGTRLPDDLDRRSLAQAVIGVMEGAMLQARVHGDLEPFDATVRLLQSHLALLSETPNRTASAASLPAPQRPPSRPRPVADWRTW
jgi:TetR/AcrR family transcriptional repressor of lmrAB and yxaGH operons